MRMDPFTLEIINESLRAAAEEMFIAWGRTSQSTIIYEVLDYACGLVDPGGGLIACANGVPGFLGILPFCVREALGKFGRDGIRPGDLFMTNDPYQGGASHLNDVCLALPIFTDGTLVAFATSKGHWSEVGGMALGSWCPDATEIFQEGLQFPCIRLYDQGVVNQAIVDVIRANVRTPDMTLGDLEGQVAAMRVGARRVEEICRKYGVAAVQAAIADLYRQGRENSLALLARLPQGTFAAEDWIDDDGISDQPIPVRVAVTIGPGEFTVDITGSAPQAAGPINTTATAAMAAIRTAFIEVLDPYFPANEGSFAPVRWVLPPGTIFTAQRPAPTSTYWESGSYISDLIFQALAPHIPERIPAGHFLSVCGTILGGVDSRTGRYFIMVEPELGGWGGSLGQDGASGLFCKGDGETYVIPVEVAEVRYPIRVERFGLNAASAPGPGQFRGGYGVTRDYRVLNPAGAEITSSMGRHRFPPWGTAGGGQGGTNNVEIYRAWADPDRAEPETRAGKVARIRLAQGDLVRLATGGGGGAGDPRRRDPRLVRSDVRNELLQPEVADAVYGPAWRQPE